MALLVTASVLLLGSALLELGAAEQCGTGNESICKPGFEPFGGECLACTPGLFSDDGHACAACPNGTVASAAPNTRVFSFDRGYQRDAGYEARGFAESAWGEEGLVFDGVDDHVVLEPWVISGGFSVELYFRYEAPEQSIAQLAKSTLFDLSGTDSFMFVHLLQTSEGKLELLIKMVSEKEEVRLSFASFSEIFVWTHLLITTDDLGNVRVFKNGALTGHQKLRQLATKFSGVMHYVGEATPLHSESLLKFVNHYFRGTMRSIVFYDHALELDCYGAWSSSTFGVGLMGAVTPKACSTCSTDTPKCSEVTCGADFGALSSTSLGSLVCPPCTPDNDDRSFVQCSACPSTGCDGIDSAPGFPVHVLLVAFMCAVIAAHFYRQRKKRRNIAVATADAIVSETDAAKSKIMLNVKDDDGHVQQVWWRSLCFVDAEHERRYSEHIVAVGKSGGARLAATSIRLWVAIYALLLSSMLVLYGASGLHVSLTVSLSWFVLVLLVAFFSIEVVLRSCPPRLFQLVMMIFQATSFGGFFGAILVVAPKRHVALYFVTLMSVVTTLLMLSSNSVFSIKWSRSIFSNVVLSIICISYPMTFEDSALGNNELTSVYKYFCLLLTWLFVLPMVARFLRETEIARRTEWISGWLKDEANRKQTRQIQKATSKIATMSTQLRAAQDELQDTLARNSVRSRLRARPPAPFTLEEFQAAVDEDDERELNELVVALCSDWVFNSPIDDAKWAYFRTYVVQLPLWREPPRFAELQSIARDASKVVKTQVVRLLETMSSPDSVHGTWLADELDHINSDRNIASLASWVDPKLICASDVLSTPVAKQEFEVEVMPTAVRALSNMLFEPFKTRLSALSPRVLEEDDGPIHGRTKQRRFSTLELLDSEETEGSLLLRCSREKSVKGAKRMGAKVEEAHASGVPFPAINNIGDALRASLSAATSEGVRECWNLVERNFEVIRLKNKFKTAIAELRSGGELHTVSPNLHVNCLFKHDVDGKEVRIVVELQIYAVPILETKREAHKIYDVTRARSIDALLS